MTDAALESAPKKAPRRWVVIGVVTYCLLAWAALFQVVHLGANAFQRAPAHYAQANTFGRN